MSRSLGSTITTSSRGDDVAISLHLGDLRAGPRPGRASTRRGREPRRRGRGAGGCPRSCPWAPLAWMKRICSGESDSPGRPRRSGYHLDNNVRARVDDDDGVVLLHEIAVATVGGCHGQDGAGQRIQTDRSRNARADIHVDLYARLLDPGLPELGSRPRCAAARSAEHLWVGPCSGRSAALGRSLSGRSAPFGRSLSGRSAPFGRSLSPSGRSAPLGRSLSGTLDALGPVLVGVGALGTLGPVLVGRSTPLELPTPGRSPVLG